ncbi:hypothetical protein BGZ57DRAFT_879159 [Hyaloscypha finlandica]|nr:hypothetical protein BGZ57DRAFT_879159 [Hyaloscypha finlandica]
MDGWADGESLRRLLLQVASSKQQRRQACSNLTSPSLSCLLSFFLSLSLSLSPVSARLPALLPTLQSTLALQCSGRKLEHNSKRPLPDSFSPRMPQSGPAPATSPTASMVLSLRSFRGTTTQWRVRRGRFKWSASFSRRAALHCKRCHATKQSLLQQTRSIPYIYNTPYVRDSFSSSLWSLGSGVCMYCTVPGFLQSAGARELVRKYCVYHATRSSDRSRLVENGSRMGQGLVGHSHINRGFW